MPITKPNAIIMISFIYTSRDILSKNTLISKAAGSMSAMLLPDSAPIIPSTLPNDGTRIAIIAVSNIQNMRTVAVLNIVNMSVLFSENESGIINSASNMAKRGLENKV